MVAPVDGSRYVILRGAMKAWEFVTHPRKWSRVVSVLVGKVKQRVSSFENDDVSSQKKNNNFARIKTRNGKIKKINKRKIKHVQNPDVADAHAQGRMNRTNITGSKMRTYQTLGRGSFGKAETVLPPVGEAGPIDVRKTPNIPDYLLEPDESISKYVEPLDHEYEMLKSLDHPGIVKVNSGNGFAPQKAKDPISMQYGGWPLDDLRKKEALTPPLVKKLTQQSLEALGYLRAHNILHKDIKPENIVMDAGGDIKLIDFGASEKLEEGEKTKLIGGTPRYMAPEYLKKNGAFELSSDIYSLGCTVYKIVTGEDFRSVDVGGMAGVIELRSTPFPQDKLDNIEGHIRNHASDLPDDFIRNIARLLQRMMEPDPAKRITAEEALKHPFFSQ